MKGEASEDSLPTGRLLYEKRYETATEPALQQGLLRKKWDWITGINRI